MRLRVSVHVPAHSAVLCCPVAVCCRVLCVDFLCAGRCEVPREQRFAASLPLGRGSHSRTHRTRLQPPGVLVQRRSRAIWLYPPRIL